MHQLKKHFLCKFCSKLAPSSRFVASSGESRNVSQKIFTANSEGAPNSDWAKNVFNSSTCTSSNWIASCSNVFNLNQILLQLLLQTRSKLQTSSSLQVQESSGTPWPALMSLVTWAKNVYIKFWVDSLNSERIKTWYCFEKLHQLKCSHLNSNAAPNSAPRSLRVQDFWLSVASSVESRNVSQKRVHQILSGCSEFWLSEECFQQFNLHLKRLQSV